MAHTRQRNAREKFRIRQKQEDEGAAPRLPPCTGHKEEVLLFGRPGKLKTKGEERHGEKLLFVYGSPTPARCHWGTIPGGWVRGDALSHLCDEKTILSIQNNVPWQRLP